jgi:hypothetical protein
MGTGGFVLLIALRQMRGYNKINYPVIVQVTAARAKIRQMLYSMHTSNTSSNSTRLFLMPKKYFSALICRDKSYQLFHFQVSNKVLDH